MLNSWLSSSREKFRFCFWASSKSRPTRSGQAMSGTFSKGLLMWSITPMKMRVPTTKAQVMPKRTVR